MATSTKLPPTMRALVCPAKGEPLAVQHIPTPQPTPGSVVVQVIATGFDKNIPEITSGKSFFTFPEPFVPGERCIGRVAAIGPDTTSLKPGQLVLIDAFLRARDDRDIQGILGIYDGPSSTGREWFAANWRNGTFAEYIAAPLENVHALNEDILCTKQHYTPIDLTYLLIQIISFGGLRGINLQPGETVIISPATGSFSGAAISVAVAMGATVIAASRNLPLLQKIQSHYPRDRVHIAALTGDVDTDTKSLTSFGAVDAYIDISPPAAEQSTHFKSCFAALRPYGRVSLMGVLQRDIPVPYAMAVLKNLTIRAQYMYERDDVRALIRLAESGLLKMGKEIGCEVVGDFGLEDHVAAAKCAGENDSYGKITNLSPWK